MIRLIKTLFEMAASHLAVRKLNFHFAAHCWVIVRSEGRKSSSLTQKGALMRTHNVFYRCTQKKVILRPSSHICVQNRFKILNSMSQIMLK